MEAKHFNLALNYMRHVILLTWVIWSAAAGAAPFQNGGFEIPDSLGVGEEQVLATGDTSIAGWKVGGTNGSVSRIRNSSEPWPHAHSGQYVIGFEKDRSSGGWIEQTFHTTVGNTFQVSMFVMALSLYNNGARFTVEVYSETGEKILSVETGVGSPGLGAWGRYQASFVATTPLSTIRITDADNPSASLRFDEVRIEAANPEMQIGLYPGVTVVGLVGRGYSIEYKNSVSDAEWTTLKTFQLEQSPTLVFDEEGIHHPKRVYRVTLVP